MWSSEIIPQDAPTKFVLVLRSGFDLLGGVGGEGKGGREVLLIPPPPHKEIDSILTSYVGWILHRNVFKCINIIIY